MDKLIKYVNARQDKGSKVNVFYSTSSCYLNAVHQSNQTFTTKTDDFFPYGSDQHSYWTGYFTSRPALKRYERVGNNFLQVCKQIDVLAQLKVGFDEDITYLREAMGVLAS
jgi:lysosomal alpha-mannosidase